MSDSHQPGTPRPDAARRSARRAAIRRFHPDAGGTAAELDAALRAPATEPATVIATRRGRLRRRWHLTVRQWRRTRNSLRRRTSR
ncbi:MULTISPECIES: hypothetical protein [Mycobacteriaceae]|uniref:hypothetical protein n=1 Tax=Mycobacteriaceae TaxID=1762 RepID=UPI0007FE3E9E|nr:MULTISPECIES: hypothetical protein [Mycobacteriaceae]MCK0176088.1 hypothetical protein [Mycolicibacterium sp. F2034L]OBB58237.1 hypothetical protein A5757_17225 [Mycobacterium sp. 852013-51886_SCH5428379]